MDQAVVTGRARASVLRSADRALLGQGRAGRSCSLIEYDGGADYAGASPHYHERHTDAFYVLEGELQFTLGRETHPGPAGTAVVAPPGVVHALHEPRRRPRPLPQRPRPDAGFADYLRARTRMARTASFDSVDVDGPQEPGGGTVLGPGRGNGLQDRDGDLRLQGDQGGDRGLSSRSPSRRSQPGTSGPPLHSHRELLDSFYVLEGTLDLQSRRREGRGGPGGLRCATAGHRRTRSPIGAPDPCASST